MIKIKRLETVSIEATTEKEVQDLVNMYVKNGYKAEEIYISDNPEDEFLFFCYAHIDEFEE